MIDLKENILLKNHTTFRIGGPARYFTTVSSEEELIGALNYAKENNLEFFILGGGSNLLVSGKGYNGIVIKLKAQSSKLKATTQNSKLYFIECWAGTPLALLVNESVNNNLTGMEWAAGIPGTVGGAIRGNAGAFGKWMSDVIENIKVLVIPSPPKADKLREESRSNTARLNTPGSSRPPMLHRGPQDDIRILEFQSRECQFGYRTSIFKQNKNIIILSATVKLQLGNKEESQRKIKEIIGKRIAKQPKAPSAGSFFLNPVVTLDKLRKEFEQDRGIKCKDEKLPAGWIIDQAGLRGKKIGGAMVSEEHTNFIVNTGNATAEDVIMLVSIIKQQVRDKLGVELMEETQYLGF